jgi:trimeric autotransporter adhesin
MRVSLLLVAALLAAPALAQAPPRLTSLLDVDGTFRPPAGFSGSVDAAGYRVETGPDGQPRFLLDEGDQRWDDRFGRPGISLYLNALAVAPGGDLYAGGYFYDAGGMEVSGIARWDGRRWHALGGGVESGRYVYAIAVGPDGAVYAGGDFALAGGARVNGIARWDGQAWGALGRGVEGEYGGSGTVRALAFRGNDLYVGGDFALAGGTAIGGVARWDGQGWHPLGQGIGRESWDGSFEPVTGTVYALAVLGDGVYVGGWFDAVETGAANGIARWDPASSTWAPLAGGTDAGSGYPSPGTVRALAAEGTSLYVGGAFGRVGEVAARNVARWDGEAWHALGDGLEGQYGAEVRGLAVYGGAVYATGVFDTAGGLAAARIARWDGQAWSAVRGGLSSTGTALAAGPEGLFVGGEFDYADGDMLVNRAARWDGARWHALGMGLTYSSIAARVSAVAAAPDGVYAGGNLNYAAGLPAGHVVRWDGEAWDTLEGGTGGTNGTVYALAVAPGGDVYTGGTFTTAGGRSANHVARWSPTTRTWSALGNGVNGPVYALALGDDGTLYVGGSFTAAGATSANRAARWDPASQTWNALGSGMNGTVRALAVRGTEVFAGGEFTRVGDGDANGVALWNGTNWSALGTGVFRTGSYGDFPGHVYAITTTPTEVYVGGDFAKAGTVAAAGVARWHPATGWAALSAGLGGGQRRVHAFARAGGALYVGGDFEAAGGLTVNHVARWDPAAGTWAPLGSGVVPYSSDIVHALATGGTDLYVGGYLAMAGGKPSYGFARYERQGDLIAQPRIEVDPPELDFGAGAPGGFLARTLTVRNPADATADLTVTVGASAGADAAAFTVASGGGTFTLAPGQSRQVVVEFRPTAERVYTASLPLTHNAPAPASPIQVALTGTGASQGGFVVLRNFDPSGPQLLWTAGQGGGYVFGPNGYGDRAKATALTLPAGRGLAQGEITEVRLFFAYKGPMVGDARYTLRLHEGTPETGPQGAPLFSESYRIADVRADEDPQTPSEATVHALPQPVPVEGSFFVVVDFGAYASTDLAALAATDRQGRRVPEVWELWSDGRWMNVSDAWFGESGQPGGDGWHLWVEAVAGTSGTSTEAGGGPGRLALHAAYPNPFAEAATLPFELPEAGVARVAVYDVLGREVARLVDGALPAGRHTARLEGGAYASGTYVVRLEVNGEIRTRRISIAR